MERKLRSEDLSLTICVSRKERRFVSVYTHFIYKHELCSNASIIFCRGVGQETDSFFSNIWICMKNQDYRLLFQIKYRTRL